MAFAAYEKCFIEYSVAGRGKGLVLVHGTGQTAENTWPDVVRHFAPARKVVCPNYSGSGNTADNCEELTVAFLAEQVLAVADHAGLDKFDIVGHSLGTCVAMQLAAQHPERVDKVVLLAGFTSAADARMQLQFRMWKEMALANPRLLAEMFMFTAFSPAFVAGMNDSAVKSIVEEIFNSTDWKGAARQIDLDLQVNVEKEAKAMTQRTLVIGCRNDFIVPVAHSRELMNLIRNAQYEELEAGHGGVTENPGQFIQLLDNFLK